MRNLPEIQRQIIEQNSALIALKDRLLNLQTAMLGPTNEAAKEVVAAKGKEPAPVQGHINEIAKLLELTQSLYEDCHGVTTSLESVIHDQAPTVGAADATMPLAR